VVVAALLPGIGIIVGLIMLAKKKPKTGLLMIGVGILNFFLLHVVSTLGR
jgi:uncharacterized membrane protein YhfC